MQCSFSCITLSLRKVRTGSPVSCSVVDRHQNDADPDPDPTFHFDVQILILSYVGKLYICFTFIHSSLHCFICLVSIMGVIIFNILESILKFSDRKYSLALHLVEMDPDPNRDLQTSCLYSRCKKTDFH